MTAQGYYPENAVIKDFAPNETPLVQILLSFGSIITAVLVAAIGVSRRVNPTLGFADLAQICWFVQSGYLHLFFEGYLLLNHGTLAASQDLFAQLWKEYALSDSRYLTSDTFVLSIETITVLFWAPCCLATAVCIVKGSNLRYPLQVITCVAHLCSVTLYFATSYADMRMNGIEHSRPEFLYLWVYYVFMNAPWAIFPAVILLNSVQKIRHVFDVAEKLGPAALGSQAAKKSQ